MRGTEFNPYPLIKRCKYCGSSAWKELGWTFADEYHILCEYCEKVTIITRQQMLGAQRRG